MKESLFFLKGLIAAAEKADPRIRKQQMFGGCPEKEKEFVKRIETVKDHYLKKMFNITKRKFRTLNNQETLS